MKTITFRIWMPFAHVWREVEVYGAVAASAYELLLRDYGIKYERT